MAFLRVLSGLNHGLIITRQYEIRYVHMEHDWAHFFVRAISPNRREDAESLIKYASC